jgi:hypothetical protein
MPAIGGGLSATSPAALRGIRPSTPSIGFWPRSRRQVFARSNRTPSRPSCAAIGTASAGPGSLARRSWRAGRSHATAKVATPSPTRGRITKEPEAARVGRFAVLRLAALLKNGFSPARAAMHSSAHPPTFQRRKHGRQADLGDFASPRPKPEGSESESPPGFGATPMAETRVCRPPREGKDPYGGMGVATRRLATARDREPATARDNACDGLATHLATSVV